MAFNDIPQYRQWIVREAQSAGVPSDLALRLATRESGIRQYNADGSLMRSTKGALGVMQVLPGTAPGINLHDAESNIVAGVEYLARLFHRFGNWTLAVAAYDWGEGALAEGMRGMRRVPAETRDYVRSILGVAGLNDLLAMTYQPAPWTPDKLAQSATREIRPAVWVAGALLGAALFLLWNS